MEKGKVKIPNAGKENGYIEDAQGKPLEFRFQDSPGLDIRSLASGTPVEFERSKIGNKGYAIRVKNIQAPANPQPQRAAPPEVTLPQRPTVARTTVPADLPRPHVAESTRTANEKADGYRFLNPYNFVRTLPARAKSAEDSIDVNLLGRTASPPHDRWVGLSGTICCTLTAVTPLFVSGAEDIQQDPSSPKHKHYSFFRVNGTKTIPGSSLRGALRTIFEIVTNSCMATLGGQRLSYRLETRDARRLIPARIEKNDQDGWVLRLLNGTAELGPDYPPKELYASALRSYRAYKPTGRNPSLNPPPPVDTQGLRHGDPCWAVLRKVKFPPSWRVEGVAKSQAQADELAKEIAKNGHRDNEYRVRQGWVCFTNQNADNKHSERFFFETDPNVVSLDTALVSKYQDLIRDYQDRHANTVEQVKSDGHDPSKPFVKDPREPYKREMGFSRFVLNPAEREVKGGELVYAMLRGRGRNMTVEFLAPVSVPRVAYEKTIADLLAPLLAHCSSRAELCPACRTFGWVSEKRQEEVAYAGRVIFSDASLIADTAKPQPPMTLAILGSPKPTTTRFYLLGPNGLPSETPRSDQTVGYDGNNGKNQLRGRKLYRHHTPDAKFAFTDKKTDQNRTIEDAEGEGAEFCFQVRFENLAPIELGALLWTLELGGKGYHRLGYGKPLGLGSAKVAIQEVNLLDVGARYRSMQETGYQRLDNWRVLINQFQTAAQARWGMPFEELVSIQDLFALTGQHEPSLKVHYPYSPDPKSQGSFEWFVGNKRDKGPKLELDVAALDEGLPLIDRAGTQY